MADKLTPQQALAVRDRGGKLLVSAAAGSGKTKVLVDRLMGYLTDENDPADLDQFLIITYTKAAASELRGKIAQKLSERIAQEPENIHLQKQMQRLFLTKISTVHGFCSDILKEYAYRLDISPDFRVADENESIELRVQVMEELLDRAYHEAEEGSDFRAFVDTQGLGRDDRLVPQLIEKVYNSSMCHLDPEGWLTSCIRNAETDGIVDAADTVWGKAIVEDLFFYLDKQISAMERCLKDAELVDGYDKVLANLAETIRQLKELRSAETWDAIVEKRALDYGRLNFPRKDPAPFVSARIKAVRGACKKGLEKKLSSFSDTSDQVLQDLQQCEAPARGLIQLVREFGKAYSATKRSRRVLDFSDLEHRTLDLLLGRSRSGITGIASEVGSRFREIMVDEYQDSNGVQDAIFEVLTRKKQNCFMVGDVKQSIYQFRLADPGIFLKKYDSYVPAETAASGEGRKILLSHNFRSGPEVIEAVNDVFSSCMSPQVGGLRYTDAEALREGVPHEMLPDAGTELHALHIRQDTYAEESAYVAEQIDRMLREGTLVRKDGGMAPVKADDIVILLRSPGSVGGQYKRALEAKGIRCNTGSGTGLLQAEEIATLRSLLQVIVNPRQDIPLVSVLVSPVFGFSADDLASLRCRHKKGSIYDALLSWDVPKALHFRRTLEALRRESGVRSLTKLLERCICLTKLDSIYSAMPDGEVKRNNIHIFFKLASDFEAGMPRDLLQFLEHLDALDERGVQDAAASSGGAVTIMSIHKSKGLEFPVVFLCGLAREFNRDSLRSPILCDQDLGIGLSVTDGKNRIRYPSLSKRAIALKMMRESVSEEMRVLYVALTRARDRLIMTYSPRNLENSLEEIACRMDIDGGELLCLEASCPGDWVMTTAMGRTEAGALFALGSKPQETKVSQIPWKIIVGEAPEVTSSGTAIRQSAKVMPPEAGEHLRELLNFRYAHLAATGSPSKQTATGLKGRVKDMEAAENTRQKRTAVTRRRPSFREEKQNATAYGNIVHKVMQYIRFEHCVSEEGVREEIVRLVTRGLLTQEEAERVRLDQITAFFRTEIGHRLVSGAKCIREYKFSILDPASNYADGVEGEQVLLQGVVDCAIMDDDGITVIDFKTDRVTEETVADAVDMYRPQIMVYSDALGRIFESKIRDRYLYFFNIGRYVSV